MFFSVCLENREDASDFEAFSFCWYVSHQHEGPRCAGSPLDGCPVNINKQKPTKGVASD